VAVKVVPGNDHECPILYGLVKRASFKTHKLSYYF
jgi:hypothetical protein